MNSIINHYAIIPARKNSKGVPFKNRKFFKQKVNFLTKLTFLKKIIINTDDEYFLKKNYKNKKIETYKRNKKLSKDNVSIKEVFKDMLKNLNFKKNDILWLFYIPLLYNSKKNIFLAKKLIERDKINSICSFVNIKTHPYNVWKIHGSNVNKIIKNDVYRRQDLPKFYEHHHHVCAFKVNIFKKLNSELIYNKTLPFIINKNEEKKFIEIDNKEDLKKL